MTAFVLMTAMPPTTGHLRLVEFASRVADGVRVICMTRPREPFARERADALRAAIERRGLASIDLVHVHREIEQDPATPGYWEMWRELMVGFGIAPGDCVVASEPYGKTLADITGTTFVPHDADRSLDPAKATPVRDDPVAHFGWILPEFRPHLRTTVTVFGAESVGKTTLSKALAAELGGTWVLEYARPYLEATGAGVDTRSMTTIWRGQAALQRMAASDLDAGPFVVQDTDLFSTLGYWQLPHRRPVLGEPPAALVAEALELRSDLYILAPATIPFEADPLRFAGDRRESADEHWAGVLAEHGLPCVTLRSTGRGARLAEAAAAAREVAAAKARRLRFDRGGF